MSIAESWNRIVAWHDANTFPGHFELHGGAYQDAIDEFERAIDESLPDDLRESLLLHNGGDCWFLWYGELLTLDAMLGQWNMYREMQSRGGYAVEGDGDWIPRDINGCESPVTKTSESLDRALRRYFHWGISVKCCKQDYDSLDVVDWSVSDSGIRIGGTLGPPDTDIVSILQRKVQNGGCICRS